VCLFSLFNFYGTRSRLTLSTVKMLLSIIKYNRCLDARLHALSFIKVSSCKMYQAAGVHCVVLKDERINQQIDGETKIFGAPDCYTLCFIPSVLLVPCCLEFETK